MLHSERGMERMTTARLAEEVGVSEAALYRYFQVNQNCLKR